MTPILKDTMHERADRLEPVHVDVARLVRAGDRRLARRRTTLLGAGAVAAVVATTVPAVFSGLGPGEGDAVDRSGSIAAAFSASEPAYARGSTVHVDGRSFDVGREVHAMVQTTAGVVFTDDDGRVWSADGSAEPVEVGRTDARHPRLETDGSLVAWTEREGDVPVFAAHDQATGDVVRSSLAAEPGMGELADEDDPAMVYAVDGGTVYVRDSRGLVAWRPDTGEERVLGAAEGFTVDDVQAGQIAHSTGRDGNGAYLVGPALGEGTELPVWNGFVLSPDGRYLLGEDEPDRAKIFDARTGEVLDARAETHDFTVGYGWVNEDTWVGAGLDRPYDGASIDLLTCEVGGGCSVVADDIGTVDDVVIPLGESMDE